MSQPYIKTLELVNRKFWTSDKRPVVFKFLLSNYNVYNNPLVYQGYLLEMQPGYYYYPTTSYYDVQIDTAGVIHYALFHSVEVTPTKIVWNTGEVWSLAEVPKTTGAKNYLNMEYMAQVNEYDTSSLYKKMDAIYGQHPVVKFQQLPQ